MTRSTPLRLGATLATTVGVGYALFTFVFWAFPRPAGNFMNALFHGLTFTLLASGGGFTIGASLYGAGVPVAWAFLLGTVFGWLAGRFQIKF